MSKFKNCYWIWPKRFLEENVDYCIVETNNLKIIKKKELKECSYWYKWDIKGRVVCIYIKTKKGSKEQKYLFKELGLTTKDRHYT